MDNKEFLTARKKLGKTQKELANLLGVSLKAICSYEQGWRSIPSYIERQLLFLIVKRKNDKEKVNCWDIHVCPKKKREQCPAWEFNAGDLCWFINGTICDSKIYKNWKEKIEVCRECELLKRNL